MSAVRQLFDFIGRLSILAQGSAGLVLLVISGLIGLWVSYDPRLSWPFLLALLGSVALLLLIARAGIPPSRVAAGPVLLAGLVALYFIGQYAHFDYPAEVGLPARLGRLTGGLLPDWVFFTPHPNAVAGFLEGTLLLCLVLARQAKGIWRGCWGVTAACILYGLLVTGSRGAWSGLVLAAVIGIILQFRGHRLPLAAAGVGLVAGAGLAIYAFFAFVPAAQLPTFDSTLATGSSRLTLYRNSLALWRDYPFTGLGLGHAFAMVYSRYQLLIHVPYLYYAHNLFLSVALGQGILGLLALVWLLVAFYRFVITVEAGRLDPPRQHIFRAAWLGVTASLIHGLTDSVQISGDYWTMPMLFALAGLTIAAGRPAVAKLSRRPKFYPWLVIVALVIAGLLFWQPLISAWYANWGAVYQAKAELTPNLEQSTRTSLAQRAESYFKRSLAWQPEQPVANRRLGMMALDQQNFALAVSYLERAYRHEPHNQATLKALGYAYLWTGQLDAAQPLFEQVEFKSRLVGELGYWRWWWGRQGRQELAAYAGEMARRLTSPVN